MTNKQVTTQRNKSKRKSAIITSFLKVAFLSPRTGSWIGVQHKRRLIYPGSVFCDNCRP